MSKCSDGKCAHPKTVHGHCFRWAGAKVERIKKVVSLSDIEYEPKVAARRGRPPVHNLPRGKRNCASPECRNLAKGGGLWCQAHRLDRNAPPGLGPDRKKRVVRNTCEYPGCEENARKDRRTCRNRRQPSVLPVNLALAAKPRPVVRKVEERVPASSWRGSLKMGKRLSKSTRAYATREGGGLEPHSIPKCFRD